MVTGLQPANVQASPCAIVQSVDLGTDLPQTLVAMITSNMTRAGHPSRVIVRGDRRSSEASGLLMDSVIMTDNLATIHRSEIDRVLGSLGEMTESTPRFERLFPFSVWNSSHPR
jgi:mRNA-degrading endonuclease toxin of MazEF toxin-antitoxin module